MNLESICKKYCFIKESILKDLINNCNNDINKLLNNIQIYLNSLVKNDEIIIEYLDNFINSNVNNIDDLKLIEDLLNELNYPINENIIRHLLKKNSNLYSLISQIYYDNEKNIKDNGLILTFKDFFIIKFVEIFIEIKNIDLYELTDDSKYTTALKAYIKDIRKFQVLSREEELDLIKKYKNENDKIARQKIIEHNLKLVVYFVKNYYFYDSKIMDLIQEGNIGLMIALDRFDYTKGVKFSTYAIYWVRETIFRKIGEENDYRIPVYLIPEINRYSRLKKELEDKYQRKLSKSELSKFLNLDIKKISKYESINQIKTVYLYDTLNDNKSRIDFIKDETQNVEENYFQKNLYENLRKALNSKNISDKEREIIYRRFGFDGQNIQTFEEIGTSMRISRQAAQQLCQKAVKKLVNCKSLIPYKELFCLKEYLPSFYQFFVGTKKIDINAAIKYLNELEYEKLLNIYGNDLNNKEIIKTNENYNYIKNIIVPKVEMILDNTLDSNTFDNIKNINAAIIIKKIFEYYKDYPIELIYYTINLLNDNENSLNTLDTENAINKFNELLKNTLNNINIVNNLQTLSIYYLKSINLLQDKYSYLLDKYGYEKAIIIMLNFGFIDNNIFNIDTLSKYFSYTCEEINKLFTDYIIDNKYTINNKLTLVK